jgi:hydroxypyruvate reductase
MPGEVRSQLLTIALQAVEAVGGARRVAESLRVPPWQGPVHLIAIGKAACAMARGALEALGDEGIRDGLVITKRGSAESLPWPVIEAGHPLPDEASLAAGRRLRDFVTAIPGKDPVLVLLSGGGSALVEQLPDGVGLSDLQRLNTWLLGSGLPIGAMNAIRKRLSLLKGGRLAALLHPRPVWCLAISDVPGDDPRAIASGPLTPEPGAPADESVLPDFVRRLLAHAAPLPVADDPCFSNVRYRIIATNDDAKQAAAMAAVRVGYRAVIEPAFVEGDAVNAGVRLAQMLLDSPAGEIHVWGGETTVKLPARPGRGGRNQALALSAARTLRDQANVLFLAIGTDGSDGPTEDAGALVDGGTIARGSAAGLDAERALTAADAGSFLEASGDLVHTGPTGTNVMDLMIGLRL